MSSPASVSFARLFFWPVYFFVERIRFARSILLYILLIPDVYVAYLLWQKTTDSIDFNAKESLGVAYITPARHLLAEVQHLRVAAATGASFAERAGILSRVETRAQEVEVVEALYGEPLVTAEVWGKVRAGVAALKAAPPEKQAEVAAALGALLSGDLILNTVGNTSNLILDPDLDSYWMMDAYVVKLPILGQLVSETAVAASAGNLSQNQRIDLASTVGLINTTASDLINVNLKTALADNEVYNASEGREGNKRLRKYLEANFTETAAALNAFTDKVRSGLLVPAVPATSSAEVAAAARALITQVNALQAAVGPELDLLVVQRTDRYRDTRTKGVIAAIIAALLISYVFNGFTSSVKTQQRRIEEENERLQADILGLLTVVSQAADGDLTARAAVGEGTLGNVADAFNQMMESWQELMTAVTAQLERTTMGVTELGRTSAGMAKGASDQASAVAGAAAAVQRIRAEIGQVSTDAETAAGAAKRTQDSAQQGARSVQDVVRGMENLRTLVQSGAKKIKTLGDRSMEITSIVGTIAKISEQTNMLALNAAIEAARAGEQGRGFSVVADEVRKLAERTATATQEIDRLVRTIQAETNESVGAIERQTQVVEDEGRAVLAAGSELVRIESASNESANLAGGIVAVSRTNLNDAATVVGTMDGISDIARETERQAQESLRLSQGLGQAADQLRAALARFKVS